MAGDYHVTGFAVPETIDLLHELLDEVRLDHPEVPKDDLSMLETAVIEIAGNVVRHVGDSGTTLYEFGLSVAEEQLVGELTYAGTAPQIPTNPELPEEMAESGRGLVLAEAVLDELQHSWSDGQNRWLMVRRRRPAELEGD